MNIEGRVQVTNKVVGAPGDARDNWQIIRALSEIVGKTLSFDNQEELRMRMASTSPHLMKLDFTEPYTLLVGVNAGKGINSVNGDTS